MPEQLTRNLASLDVALTADQTTAPDAASDRGFVYPMAQISSPGVNQMIFGSHTVQGWR